MANKKRRTALVAIACNEQPYVQEWIAFYAVQGWSTIILFDNNSTDETVAKAEAMSSVVDVRIHPWVKRDPHYQTSAYKAAALIYGDEFDWMGFFDLDEFLVFEDGLSLEGALMARDTDTTIGIPWAMFGSSGLVEKPEGLVIENYRWRTPVDFGPNRHIKTIIRPEVLLDLGNPHMFISRDPYVDLAGNALSFLDSAILAETPSYALGKLNHYFVKSQAEWAAKVSKGYNGGFRTLDSFKDYDVNAVEDLSAAVLAPQVREILASIPASPPR